MGKYVSYETGKLRKGGKVVQMVQKCTIVN